MGGEDIERLLQLKALLEEGETTREEILRWMDSRCSHLSREYLTCNLPVPQKFLACLLLEERKRNCALAMFALRIWG
jgi:hypothetical protein